MAPLCIYIDVDETFVRNVDRKQLPIPDVIAHIKALKMENATLYCWSSGGADYARQRAEAFGIADCFTAFCRNRRSLSMIAAYLSGANFWKSTPMNADTKVSKPIVNSWGADLHSSAVSTISGVR